MEPLVDAKGKGRLPDEESGKPEQTDLIKAYFFMIKEVVMEYKYCKQ